MAKVWVDIKPSVVPDGEAAKKALTKAVVAKIGKAMIDQTAAALPGGFTNKDGDKPKDKRDDHAARAVRLKEELTIAVEVKGSKVYMDGSLITTLETLQLKSATEKGELVGEYTRGIKGLDKRGALDAAFDPLIAEVLKTLVGPVTQKALTSAGFANAAKQRNLPIE
jgi:hypothetical protein